MNDFMRESLSYFGLYRKMFGVRKKYKPQKVSYGTNKEQYFLYYEPEKILSDKIIVWVHGGGWNAGNPRFFDFVGQKTIENTSATVTYNKNNLDYYTAEINEKELVYNVDTKSTYTVKSHLIAEDGKWQLYDLLQSPRAWTNINGQDYVVIIESVSAAEQNNQQIYEMTVKFNISQPTSL